MRGRGEEVCGRGEEVYGRGAYKVGSMHGGGCAWQEVCMHGRGHVWRGACMVGGGYMGGMHGGGVCMAGGTYMAGETVTAAGGRVRILLECILVHCKIRHLVSFSHFLNLYFWDFNTGSLNTYHPQGGRHFPGSTSWPASAVSRDRNGTCRKYRQHTRGLDAGLKYSTSY